MDSSYSKWKTKIKVLHPLQLKDTQRQRWSSIQSEASFIHLTEKAPPKFPSWGMEIVGVHAAVCWRWSNGRPRQRWNASPWPPSLWWKHPNLVKIPKPGDQSQDPVTKTHNLVTNHTIWWPITWPGDQSHHLVTNHTTWWPITSPGHQSHGDQSHHPVTNHTTWCPITTWRIKSTVHKLFYL